MEIDISSARLRRIWQDVWNRLPQEVQEELDIVVRLVTEAQSQPNKPFAYGKYSPGAGSQREGIICLYLQDLSHLSEHAIAWVMAHELGHAYCHLKYGDPAPCPPEIDTGANCIGSGWGFGQELQAFERERKPCPDQ